MRASFLRRIIGSSLLVLLLLPATASAVDLSLRYTNLFFHTQDSLNQPIATDLNRFRFGVGDESAPFYWKIEYDHELLVGGLVRDPVYQASKLLPGRTLIDASAWISESGSIDWHHTLYRGWLQYDKGPVQLTIGRQRVAWGSGRFWNPTDRFNPVSPIALEQDQKLGVDAANLIWRYSGSGQLQLVVAPGRASQQAERKAALRWRDTFDEFDVALLAAKVGNEDVGGLDVTGNLFDGGIRLEVMHAKPAAGSGYTQLSTGYDYTWAGEELFVNGLYMAVEYFYNSAPDLLGISASSDRLRSKQTSLWAGQLGYDITPLIRAGVTWIGDFAGSSHFVIPQLSWSATSSLDLALFAQLPSGGDGGEFSGLHELYAVRLDWYF